MANYSDLKGQISSPVECTVFDSIDSTNNYLASLKFSKTTQVCIARDQTQGRGQYDRTWISQKDANILLSIRYVFDTDIALNGLSLVMGLAVVGALEKFGVDGVKLKWPNDIYIDDKKLAGILIENSVQGGYQSVVIGLGLNYQLGQKFACDSAWIDLSKIMQDLPTIESLSVVLINNLIEYCQLFSIHGWPYFSKSWQAYDYLHGKRVEFVTHDQKIIGFVDGVNQQGALLIVSNNQTVEAYSSKQIRLI